MSKSTFIRITNEDIFKELKEIKELAKKTNGKVKTHDKMIWALGASGATAFLFVLGLIFNIL